MRRYLLTLLLASLGLPLSTSSTLQAQTTSPTTTQSYELIKLPYASDALAPVISKRTVELHHGKHLAGYVSKLNSLLKESGMPGSDLVRLVRYSSGAIFDNAGQLLNHNLYFLQFRPATAEATKPVGALAKMIEASYGSFEAFQKAFEQAGVSIFGSGWLWLACDAEGKLYIDKEPNAGNPVVRGLTPLLGIDIWEHAYYLDYENRRAEHLKQVWRIIDWEVVGKRYDRRTEGVRPY